MSDCCDPISYRRFFNSKEAERRLRRYRKKGLDKRAHAILEYLKTQEIDGADVLEVGGGVGDFQVEMLKAGVATATNIELSQAYEAAATGLAADEGLSDRMARRFGDFVEIQSEVGPAEIVILNRVICCYPFMDRMMTAATGKTVRFLALVYPRQKWFTKLAIRLGNGFCALRGVAFRAFVHPVVEIERIATGSGMVAKHKSNDFIWQGVVFERLS